jgi:hypothetical protein
LNGRDDKQAVRQAFVQSFETGCHRPAGQAQLIDTLEKIAGAKVLRINIMASVAESIPKTIIRPARRQGSTCAKSGTPRAALLSGVARLPVRYKQTILAPPAILQPFMH